MAYQDYSQELDSDISQTKISKINAAALINLIMAKLWQDAHRHSIQGELLKWNADLNCIWIELAGDVDAGSNEDKEFLDIEERLAKAGSLIRKKSNGFVKEDAKEQAKHAKQYQILLEKAVFLQRLRNKQGKGTAYQDDADDYMD